MDEALIVSMMQMRQLAVVKALQIMAVEMLNELMPSNAMAATM